MVGPANLGEAFADSARSGQESAPITGPPSSEDAKKSDVGAGAGVSGVSGAETVEEDDDEDKGD